MKRSNDIVTFRITCDLNTLDRVIKILDGNCDKNFVNKLKRAYKRQRQYQLHADAVITKMIIKDYTGN